MPVLQLPLLLGASTMPARRRGNGNSQLSQ